MAYSNFPPFFKCPASAAIRQPIEVGEEPHLSVRVRVYVLRHDINFGTL
jgi:hypothetical protein